MAGREQPAGMPLAGCRSIGEAVAGLRQRGHRATRSRLALLGVLFRDRDHRSAEDLAEEVRAEAPGVHISTIYRNLDELVRLGLVSRTYIGGGPAAYRLASASHGQLLCERCGSVTEAPAGFFADLSGILMATRRFAVDPQRFAVAGWCASCQQADRPGK